MRGHGAGIAVVAGLLALVLPLTACTSHASRTLQTPKGIRPVLCGTVVDPPVLTPLLPYQAQQIAAVADDTLTFSGAPGLAPGDLLVGSTKAYGPLFRLVTGVTKKGSATVVSTCEPGARMAVPAAGDTLDVPGGATIVIPAGAFPAGTVLRAAVVKNDDAPSEATSIAGLAVAPLALVVVTDAGVAPSQPLQVALPLPADAAGPDTAFLVATQATDGTHTYASATLDGNGAATAGVDRVATYWAATLDLGAVADALVASVQQHLDLAQDAPSCYRSDGTLTVSGVAYTISGLDGSGFPCVSGGGSVALSITSPNGMAYTVATSPRGQLSPDAGLPAEASAVVAFLNSPGGRAMLYPGATLTLTFGTVPGIVTLDSHAGATLMTALVFGLTNLGATYGLRSALVDPAGLGTCIAAALGSTAGLTAEAIAPADAAAFVTAGIGCLLPSAGASGVSPLGSLVLEALAGHGDLAAAKLSDVLARVNTTGHHTFMITPVPVVVPEPEPVQTQPAPVPEPAPLPTQIWPLPDHTVTIPPPPGRTCPYPEPLSPLQQSRAAAACALGYHEYCDC